MEASILKNLLYKPKSTKPQPCRGIFLWRSSNRLVKKLDFRHFLLMRLSHSDLILNPHTTPIKQRNRHREILAIG